MAQRTHTPPPALTACTVSIPGIMPERTYPTVAAAGQALWEELRALPMGWLQAEAYRALLTDPALLHDHLTSRGPQALSFTLDGEPQQVLIGMAA